MKKLSKFEVAVLKRNMANVKPFVKKVTKLEEIILNAQEELSAVKEQISRYEDINKEMTGGLTGQQYFDAMNAGLLDSEEQTSEPVTEDTTEAPVTEGTIPEPTVEAAAKATTETKEDVEL